MSEIVKEKPIMEKVQKKYNNFVKSKLMMMEYEKKEAYLYGNQIMLDEGRILGKEEGIEQGEINKAKDIALNLKKMNMSNEDISKITCLSIKEIEKL